MPPADADPDPSGSTSPQPQATGIDADDPLSPAARPAARHQPAASVTFHLDAPDTDPPALGWIEPLLRRAIELSGLPHAALTDSGQAPPNLTLVLADDAQMADLHQRYTGVAGTTDVLTFDHRDDPTNPDEPLEADIILGRDVAVRQAESRPHDARTELLLYAVHGLLHLLGEDDHDEHAYQQMHQREDKILIALGFNPVFKSEITNPMAPKAANAAKSQIASIGGNP